MSGAPDRGSGGFEAWPTIRSPTLLYLKGFLLLSTGILASALLLAEQPSLKTTTLLAVSVWAFARAYYFAFYVVEHYIDPGYRYDGLLSFARYLLRRRKASGDRHERPGGDS